MPIHYLKEETIQLLDHSMKKYLVYLLITLSCFSCRQNKHAEAVDAASKDLIQREQVALAKNLYSYFLDVCSISERKYGFSLNFSQCCWQLESVSRSVCCVAIGRS